MPFSESGSRDDRIWVQRQPNLGAETNESGSRDGRGWDGIRHQIGKLFFPLAALWTEMGSCLVDSKQYSVYKE